MSLKDLLDNCSAASEYGEAGQSLDSPPKYTWDDDRLTKHYADENRRLAKELARPSARAGIAMVIAMSELVWLRMCGPAVDRRLPMLIEAAWASLVDWRYLRSSDLTRRWVSERGKGPVEGPLVITHRHLAAVLVNASNKINFYPDAVYISNLAEHVLPHFDTFKTWRRVTIKRIQKLYPDDPHDVFGPPVPRQAILDSQFSLNDTPRLLHAFLADLKPSENPYLSKPDEMNAAGFKGTPYRFTESSG